MEKEMNKEERSPVSGFPMSWQKYCHNGEYDCNYCSHKGDNNWCCECDDYGTLFSLKKEFRNND